MAQRRLWFDRRFPLGLPVDAFPEVLERVRGTPSRLEERVVGLDHDTLVRMPEGTWSIQENVGHLLDLEPLWAGRLDDLLARAPELRPADLENRKTHQAKHNEQLLDALLAEFRAARMTIVARLEALSNEALGHTAVHPRLKEPMTVTDLFHFVAEHDDHHLARITELVRSAATP
jgi:uncharacterized damage-inducible protein DinB